MKKYTVPVLSAVVLILLLAISAGFVFAGDGGPTGVEGSPAQVNEDVQNYFPVQGRLTDASGRPLNGDYAITFRLYDVYTGGTALCQDANLVKVVNGLFSSEVWGNCQDFIKGAQLYLSIEVEGNGEMDPRQPIFAVPYAWSLRPGAAIIGSVGPGAILHIENSDPNGRGLRAYAMSTTGANYGIVGRRYRRMGMEDTSTTMGAAPAFGLKAIPALPSKPLVPGSSKARLHLPCGSVEAVCGLTASRTARSSTWTPSVGRGSRVVQLPEPRM